MRKILLSGLFCLSVCFFHGCADLTQKAMDENFLIAYNVLVDADNSNYDVFIMNPDGSGKRNLTDHPALEWTYLAQGDQILFISDRDTCQRCFFLYAMDYEGNNVRKVYSNQLSDSWMSTRKNGKEIIVTPSRNIDRAFHVINWEGKLLERIYVPMTYTSDPLFVANDSLLVFRGGQTKSKQIEGFNEDLYVYNLLEGGYSRLTEYPEDDASAGNSAYRAGAPQWNPKEKFVSYQSKQLRKYSLYATDLSGEKQWKLTKNEQNEGWHSWSSDGKWLAIELFDDKQTQFHIGLMNWETRKMAIISDTAFKYQHAPVFVEIPSE